MSTEAIEHEPVETGTGTLAVSGKGGAPAGNRNNLRHGLFATGKMPSGSSYVVKMLGRLRRAIEAELAVKQAWPLSVYQRGLLNEALRHEKRALLLGRWLAKAEDFVGSVQSMTDARGVNVAVHKQSGLTLESRASLLREISSATAARNRALKDLGLAGEPQQLSVQVMVGQAVLNAVSATRPRRIEKQDTAPEAPSGPPACESDTG